MRLQVIASAAAALVLVAGGASAQDEADTGNNAPGRGETNVTDSRVLETRVYFAFDESALDAEAKAALGGAAGWLGDNETSLILIEGHADESGDAAYNKKLGDARAQATHDHLVSLGVDPKRIRIISYGEAVPAVDVDGKEPLNRRIVLYAVDKKPIVVTKVVAEVCPDPEPERVPVAGLDPVPPPPDVIVVEEKKDAFDFGIIGGGGVTGAIASETRALTHPGGFWNVRATFNTRYVVGVEAAYVGSAQDLDNDEGLGGSALIGNGVEGALRLNVLPGRVRPYALGGAGFMHYNLSNSGETDDVLTLPVGIGMDFRLADELEDPGFVIDLRGTVRPVFEEQLFDDLQPIPGDEDGETDLDSFSVSAQAGYAF